MEYVQMTLDQWVILKDQLKQDILDAQEKINGIRRDFVKIGYKLRKIEELKLYEKDGYKTITEFAKAECNLTDSDVTRFIQINEKYSINGYSEELQEKYLLFGSSKLSEMLTLPEKDMEMLSPDVTRENIRELKRFNKSEPAAGEADDIHVLIEKFYEANEDILNELYASEAMVTGEVDKFIEIVNPGGNKSFRKGLYFLMMYEENIKIKKHGENPQTMSWEEFFEITQEIFKESAAGSNTYKNHFCSSEQQIPGQMEIQDYPEAMSKDKHQEPVEKEEIAPAQKSEETLKILNEQGISKPPKREKTEDEKYEEQQRKIDRQTKKKLQEMEDEKKMEVLPSELPKPVHQMRTPKSQFEDEESGKKPFILTKKDKEYKVGDILERLEFDDGKYTGRTLRVEVTYLLEDYNGLAEDYCLMAIKPLLVIGVDLGTLESGEV